MRTLLSSRIENICRHHSLIPNFHFTFNLVLRMPMKPFAESRKDDDIFIVLSEMFAELFMLFFSYANAKLT